MKKKIYGSVLTAVALGAVIGATSACKHLGAASEGCAASKSTCAAGLTTSVEDGRLWVLKAGEKKSDKHITLIGAGPGGMTIKADSKDTAIEYLAAKPGFNVSVEDGRVWVLKAGEKKSDKHITMIGAGPLGATLKAADKSSALEYLGSKPGFNVSVEDDRLWVLKDGEKKSDKHITMIGAGPQGVTLKAADRATALEYLAAKPGFVTKADEEGRIWVFAEGAELKMSEKHITRVGAGPMGATLKAVDASVLDAYCMSK